MAHKLYDIPLMTALVEHYLFDLGYSIEKVSEIARMDKKAVEKIYETRIRYTVQTRKTL